MTAHYVYRCYDRDGLLAYVGCTSNLQIRLATHSAGSWWAPSIVKVSAKVYPTKDIARAVERAAIKTQHPRWNVMSRWSSRHGWTEQIWRDYYRAVVSVAGHSTPPRERHAADVARQFEALFGRPILEVSA